MAYQIFSEIIKIHKTVGVDEIVEVGKSVDEIVEVEKFNPFHDNLGRFSSSNGFASYSANPNTKAGAMAISRSVAAGHGSTKNSHKQAQGSTLNANATWLKGYGRGTTNGKNTLLRVENMGGLSQASALGAQWQSQNVSGGRSLQPSPKATAQSVASKPATQKPATAKKPAAQKPAAQQQAPAQSQGSLASDVANVNLTSSDKLAIQPRNGVGFTQAGTKTADDNYQQRVAGKDISKSFDVNKTTINRSMGEGAIDAVAEAQGWRKSPTVTNDLETFQKAAMKSGQILVRSVGAYTAGDGTKYSAKAAAKQVMSDGKASLNGNGAQCYGGGLYLVGAKVSSGNGRNANTVASAQRHSFMYNNQQMMATVHPSAKIATPSQTSKMSDDFSHLSSSSKAKFGYDVGAYIASKGYDGAQWHSHSNPYVTMYNKSALIFYGSTASKR